MLSLQDIREKANVEEKEVNFFEGDREIWVSVSLLLSVQSISNNEAEAYFDKERAFEKIHRMLYGGIADRLHKIRLLVRNPSEPRQEVYREIGELIDAIYEDRNPESGDKSGGVK